MEDKLTVYEAHLEDMLCVIQTRLHEFAQMQSLDDFEQGRLLAYTEMWEIIQTRHRIILEVLGDEDMC